MKRELRVKIWEKFGRHCAYCGKKLAYKDLQVDHIIPQSDIESSDSIENLNPSCRRCNLYKSNRSLEEFRKLLTTLHKRIYRIFILKVAIDFHIISAPQQWDSLFYFEVIKNKQDEG